MPNGVKLFLRPFTDDSYLLRVQNFNLQQASFTVPSGWTATEYTLSANQLQSDWESSRMKWVEEKEEEESMFGWAMKEIGELYEMFESMFDGENDVVKLNFLQMRTFKIIK